MDMDAIVGVILAIIAVALVAGSPPRLGMVSARRGGRRALAPVGGARTEPSPIRPSDAPAARGRQTETTPSTPYPTLARIDRARGEAEPRLCARADAARLERIARALTAELWGETVWLTGVVPPAAFDRVCAILDRERLAIETPSDRDALPAA